MYRPSRLLIPILTCLCLLGARPLSAADNLVDISPELDQAIDRGLAWLANTQEADGSWESQGYGKNVGAISLALLGLMARGNLPGEGRYGHVVGKGVQWILAQAKPTGIIQFTEQSKQAPVMYGQALATLMLSEVWGQTRYRDERGDIAAVLRRAVDLIIQVQGPKGGWGYKSVPQDGDTSVCVMQVMALKSAQEAGIYVPEDTITRAIELIKTRYNEQTNTYGYRSTKFAYNHMGSSAAGTTIMFITGEDDPRYSTKAQQRLLRGLRDEIKQIGHKHYFTYYGSVSAYIAGEKQFAEWMKYLEPWLLKSQRSNGAWGATHDTGFAILAAALPYRYLPIYQR
jgi:squalene cyclase